APPPAVPPAPGLPPPPAAPPRQGLVDGSGESPRGEPAAADPGAGAAGDDVGGDVELVASPGHHADGDTEGQRLLGDPHAAVTDGDGGLAQDRHVGEVAGD